MRRFQRFLKPIVYGLVVALLMFAVLREMRLYLNAPNTKSKVWDRAAKQVRRGWQAGDRLHFYPSWVSGYMMDRRRFVGLAHASEPVGDLFDIDDGRIWFVSLYADARKVERVDAQFTSVSTEQFGPIRVQLLTPRAP